MYRERQHYKRGQRNGQLSWTGPVSQRILGFFFSWSSLSHCFVPDSAHSSDTCINGILAWNCRCWKVIVQKQLCLSYSLFLSPSLILYQRLFHWLLCPFTASLRPSFSLFHAHTHTNAPPLLSIHSFSHYWSVSALENCCTVRGGVITIEINHFLCDCRTIYLFQHSYLLHQVVLTEGRPSSFH